LLLKASSFSDSKQQAFSTTAVLNLWSVDHRERLPGGPF